VLLGAESVGLARKKLMAIVTKVIEKAYIEQMDLKT
jgi:hypothetical protein